MKKIVIPSNFEQIKQTLDYADAYLLGVKNMAVNLPVYFTVDELRNIDCYLKKNNKELFISVNKNIHNHELDTLKDILSKLNQLNVKAVFYYDIAIPNLKNELQLEYDLVWAQEHLTNNYYTCNYWYSYGVKYAMLSSEITLNEILEIKNNTDMNLIVSVLGYTPIFTSKRNLVKNYIKTFNLQDNQILNYLEKEGHIYPIKDDNLGTTVYSSKILNASLEIPTLNKNKIDYILINSFNIEDATFIKIMKKINLLNDDNKDKINNEINQLLNNNTDTGFMHKETIYKVK